MALYAKVSYEVMDFTSFDIQESTDEIEITESEFYLLGVHFKKIDNSRYKVSAEFDNPCTCETTSETAIVTLEHKHKFEFRWNMRNISYEVELYLLS